VRAERVLALALEPVLVPVLESVLVLALAQVQGLVRRSPLAGR
jgi:hypothetical protein